MRWAVPGGVSSALSAADRDWMLGQYDEMLGYLLDGIAIAKQWLGANQDLIQRFANFKTGYMGLVKDGALELYDGKVRLTGKDGKLLEEFEDQRYLDYVSEWVEDWSYLKFPFYKKMGFPEGVYRAGPLARLNVADKISTPMANEEFKKFKALSDGPVEPSLYFHYARLIEAVYGFERAKELLEDPVYRYPCQRDGSHRRGDRRYRGPEGYSVPSLLDRRNGQDHSRQPHRGHRQQQLGYEQGGRYRRQGIR